jgi:asparagine synthase (glutamine-hydrolysing)
LRSGSDDAQLALQVYLRDGVTGLTSLKGAFFIAVWDAHRQELSLINDRFGLYPHYYAHRAGGFAFAPEMKAVVCAPGVRRTLDMTAVAEYTRLQQILGERTWLEDVTLVPPATIMRYRPAEDRLDVERYWDWDSIQIQPTIQFDDAVEESIRLMQRAVDAMCAGPERIGIYHSGGLDARMILGFTDPHIPVTTITYGAEGCRDVVYAARIARRAGRPHYWVPLVDGRWVLDNAPLHFSLTEGMHSWMHAHGMSTLDEARALIDVNLSGWDGGTVVGSLLVDFPDDPKYRAITDESTLTAAFYNAFCAKITWPGLTNDEARQLYAEPGDSSLSGRAFESFRSAFARTSHYSRDRRLDYFFIEQHDRRSTQNMIVFGRSAIEERCPYFDYDLVDFMYSLPEPIRCGPELQRAIITRRMPRLATIPYEHDDRLPHSNPLIYHGFETLQRAKHWTNRKIHPIFLDRPKLYADYENYLRHELRPWAESILFDPHTEARGLFNPKAVRALWERHVRGGELWTIGKIAPLMSIELVQRYFVDGDAAAVEPLVTRQTAA